MPRVNNLLFLSSSFWILYQKHGTNLFIVRLPSENQKSNIFKELVVFWSKKSTFSCIIFSAAKTETANKFILQNTYISEEVHHKKSASMVTDCLFVPFKAFYSSNFDKHRILEKRTDVI